MAQPPSLTRLPVDTLGSDTPQWFQDLLTPLNEFLSATTGALGKGLTLQDNVQCAVVPQTFTAKLDANNNYTLNLTNPLTQPPVFIYVSMLNVKGGAGANVQKNAWSYTAALNSQKQVSIVLQGLQSGVTYTCNVIMW